MTLAINAIDSSFKMLLVLQLVLDELDAKRKTALRFRDCLFSNSYRLAIDGILDGEDTMKRLSLVCRSWSGPSRRMLGRSLLLLNANARTVSSARSSGMFGSWTTSANLIFTDTTSAVDEALWRDMDGLFECISNVRCLYFAGEARWNDERFALVDSLSPALTRLHNLEKVTICRFWSIVSGDLKPEAHPELFAALSSSPGLQNFVLQDFMPVPGADPHMSTFSKDGEVASSTRHSSLGDACLQAARALCSDSVPRHVRPYFVSFTVCPNSKGRRNKAVEYCVESLQLSGLGNNNNTVERRNNTLGPTSSAVFEHLTEFGLEFFDPASVWWIPFIPSESLRFMSLHCLVDKMNFEFQDLLKRLPVNLEELLVGVTTSLELEEDVAGTDKFNKRRLDKCVADSVAHKLPNLRVLHLEIWDHKSANGGKPVTFPDTMSRCAMRGIKFTWGGYTLRRQPFEIVPRSVQPSPNQCARTRRDGGLEAMEEYTM